MNTRNNGNQKQIHQHDSNPLLRFVQANKEIVSDNSMNVGDINMKILKQNYQYFII